MSGVHFCEWYTDTLNGLTDVHDRAELSDSQRTDLRTMEGSPFAYQFAGQLTVRIGQSLNYSENRTTALGQCSVRFSQRTRWGVFSPVACLEVQTE